MSRNVTDEDLQEPISDVDETSAYLLLNAIETWERILGQSGIRRDLWNRITLDKIKENALPSLDHSVKHNGKFDKTYKALKDTFDDDEDSDDMIGNIILAGLTVLQARPG